MKARILLVCILVAMPVFSPAASKEIQELQRDIALQLLNFFACGRREHRHRHQNTDQQNARFHAILLATILAGGSGSARLSGREACATLLSRGEVRPAVLLPAAFVLIGALWTLFAVAD